jgi:hypothetical protein
VLLDGSLGSFIGTAGAFGVAAWAFRHERAQRRESEVQRLIAEKEERRRRAVASIAGLIRTLEMEARLAPLLAGRTILALSTALMTFEAEVGGEHPEVTNWVMNRYGELVTNLNAWRRAWWVPRLKRRRIALAANGLARLTDVLTKWSTGSLTDAQVVATTFAQNANGKTGVPSA